MLRFLREWRDRSRILRDERKFEKQDNRRARQIVDDHIQAGRRALDSRDREAALRHWQEAWAHQPDLTMASRDGLWLLIGLRRFDEAEALMDEGCRRRPRNPFFPEGAAIVAERRGDHEAAAQHYATLRRKFPRVIAGYVDGIGPLIKLGRIDEADKVLGRATVNGGTNRAAIEHARLAMLRQDWPVALTRWTKLSNDRPQEAAAIGIAQCYKEMGRFDDAEQVLTEALKRPWANALGYWREMALIAERREAWDVAARRWDDVRKSAPLAYDAYGHCAFALGKCGRDTDAELVLRDAMERFPSGAQAWIDYARIAERRGSTQEAQARWEQVRVKFPEHADQGSSGGPADGLSKYRAAEANWWEARVKS